MDFNLFYLSLFPLPLASFLESFQISNASGKVIVIVLLVGSVLAWSVMITKLLEVGGAVKSAKKFFNLYRENRQNPLELFTHSLTVNKPKNPLHAIYLTVCVNLMRIHNLQVPSELREISSPLADRYLDTIRELADQTMAAETLKMEQNMNVLATAVTSAPFLGLLGTVWGIMDAFGGLALSSTATLAAVAPGVSGALLTTVVGLMVALPSTIGYNYLAGKIRCLNLEMETFEQELMADLLLFLER